MKLKFLFVEELDFIGNIVIIFISWVLGFISNLAIEAFKKRKNPRELDSSVTSEISSAAKDTIEASRSIVVMLDERLASERVYFDEQIEKSKKDCEEKIKEMQLRYERELYQVRINGEQEKYELSKQIDQLKKDKTHLQEQVSSLEARLSKYESLEHK